MAETWDQKLPDEFRDSVIEPVQYTQLSDGETQAWKIWGVDQSGARCFYEHEFTVSEDRFDADEFPIIVDVFWEHVTAWRLHTGRWVKLRKWTEQMDRCPRRYVTEPVEIVDERQLQR